MGMVTDEMANEALDMCSTTGTSNAIAKGAGVPKCVSVHAVLRTPSGCDGARVQSLYQGARGRIMLHM